MYIRSLLFSALALSSLALQAAPQPETITNEIDSETGELRITVQGQGFGPGPNVLFFHDFRGAEDGTLVESTQPRVGELVASAGDPSVGSYLEQKGFWVINEETERWTLVKAVLPEHYEDIFIAYSVAVPEGKTSPSQDEPETWGGSTWKFSWLLEENGSFSDSGQFDLVMPQQNGNAGTLHGNASQFREIGSGTAATIAPMSEWWSWGRLNYLSGWIKADKTDSTRSTGNFSAVNKEFGFKNFNTTSDMELVGPAPKVSQVNFPGWVRDTDDDDFQAIYGDLYVSGGANMWARIEITDSANYSTSGYRKLLLPENWSEDSIETSISLDAFQKLGPLYIHVFNAEGKRSSTGLLACQKCPVMTPL